MRWTAVVLMLPALCLPGAPARAEEWRASLAEAEAEESPAPRELERLLYSRETPVERAAPDADGVREEDLALGLLSAGKGPQTFHADGRWKGTYWCDRFPFKEFSFTLVLKPTRTRSFTNERCTHFAQLERDEIPLPWSSWKEGAPRPDAKVTRASEQVEIVSTRERFYMRDQEGVAVGVPRGTSVKGRWQHPLFGRGDFYLQREQP